jgi:hypothetical protein
MKRLNTNEFVIRAHRIHGDLYNYSKSSYVKSKEKTIIICPTHGDFAQSPNAHLNGQGCPKCKKCYRPNTKEFVTAAIKVHGREYSYAMVKYISCSKKVRIICKHHGSFLQSPSMHLSGRGCPRCAPNCRKTLGDFIIKSKQIHGNLYDYSQTGYERSNAKVTILCRRHGKFLQTPSMHLCGNGCPKCKNSKGEIEISKWLNENKFVFENQKMFRECRNPSTNFPLKFDFYLPKENVLIEYDGEQHFGSYHLVGGIHTTTPREYYDIRRKDRIKTTFALSNNIKLIRIPYTKFGAIGKILNKHLLCLK